MLPSSVKWFFSKINLNGNRALSSTPIRFDDGHRLSGQTHKVNNFERKLLVWMGKYKTAEEVPPFVAPETVEKARSRMRIRISNWLMVLTLVGCLAMVYSGKQARQRGESLQQYNLEMHEKYNKDETVKSKSF